MVEIFRWSTRHKPGIRRLTQRALLTVFILTVAYAASNFVNGKFGSPSRAVAALGRDLRYVEAGILLLMLCCYSDTAFRWPQSPGFVDWLFFWVGVNVVNLALWFVPEMNSRFSSRAASRNIPLHLGIWCVTLWSVHPEPVQPAESRIERDYELLAGKTQAVLARASTRVARIMRP